ncbi:phage tail protein [Pseudomonas atacamensis]|uniref:phage tail protein n=1 Tax=Pseudomonas atacamensis TaxID=2565368 RepID=UPI003209E421
MRYYSKATGSTYLDSLHSRMPDDVVPITEDRYLEVFANRPLGKVCGHDQEGLPILIDIPALTPVERAEEERGWRDEQISAILWLRERHRDQLDLNQSSTLTADQFNELLNYIRQLRDWPQSSDFPLTQARPVKPEWIAKQIE